MKIQISYETKDQPEVLLLLEFIRRLFPRDKLKVTSATGEKYQHLYVLRNCKQI